MRHFAILAALLAISGPALAQDAPAVTLGELGFGGTGCPDGTAIPSVSGSAATLMFDAYKVGDSGRSVDRKTCAIAIPVTVPAGIEVAVRGVALRGVATLPEGLDATLNVEAFVAGDSGEVVELPLTGPRDGYFFRVTTVPDDRLVWSGCGADANLRVNTSLRTRGTADASVDIEALTVFRVVRAC